MEEKINTILETGTVEASAPCRMDMGGTLDIPTFYYPLSYLDPSTFNIAVDLRTRVAILPFKKGMVRVSSEGFAPAAYPMESLPFNHPLGLIFAVAAHFRVDGIHIRIDSSSPPKSALGGSSAAAVALIGAYNRIFKDIGRARIPLDRIPFLAHAIEESVAGVPCGLQDQLAATYGGIHAWSWKGTGGDAPFTRRKVSGVKGHDEINRHLLLAYCGIPHESKQVNARWVKQFIEGSNRAAWVEIAECTNAFICAFDRADFIEAARLMNRETGIRLEMTPDVLDECGKRLCNAAAASGCGARFTGAGGGGCVWALGGAGDISKLQAEWEQILSMTEGAALLDVAVDPAGLKEENAP